MAQWGSEEMVLMIWHLAEEIKNVAKPLTNRITKPQISVVATEKGHWLHSKAGRLTEGSFG